MDFLGLTIKNGTLRISDKHIRAIRQYPVPTNVRAVRGFLGLANYCSEFLKRKSELCSPLYALTKKNVKFHFDDQCMKAFLEIKEKLLSAPVLTLPNMAEKFILESDASTLGLASLIYQNYDGKKHIVGYFSRTLKSYERNYSSYTLELLSLVESVMHFSVYLLAKPFEI